LVYFEETNGNILCKIKKYLLCGKEYLSRKEIYISFDFSKVASKIH